MRAGGLRKKFASAVAWHAVVVSVAIVASASSVSEAQQHQTGASAGDQHGNLEKMKYPFLSDDGQWVVFAGAIGDDYDIFVAPFPDMEKTIPLTQGSGSDQAPALSPDGRQVLFESDRDGDGEIYLINANGTGLANLSQHSGEDWHPKWAPDGKSVIFTSNRLGDGENFEIFEMGADGTGLRRLTDFEGWDTFPSLDSAGRRFTWRRLLETGDGSRNPEIFLAPRSGEDPQNLTRHPAFDTHPSWSPDGSSIFFSSNRSSGDPKRFEVFVVDAETLDVQKIVASDGHDSVLRPRVSKDCRQLVYNREIEGRIEILSMDLEDAGFLCQSESSDEFFPRDHISAIGPVDHSRGVAWGDYDGDGDPDLAVAYSVRMGIGLFRNDGDGGFVPVPDDEFARLPRWTEGVSWADVDNDGDLDLFAATQDDTPNALFRNINGNLVLEEESGLSKDGTASTGACWADFDRDGDLDVYVVNRDREPDTLFENTGHDFAAVADGPAHPGDGRACAWADLSGDGWPDLVVVNFRDPETGGAANVLFESLGGGRLKPAASLPGNPKDLSYGVSPADVDGDGDLDLYVTNIGLMDFNRLYRNDGNGMLSEWRRTPLVYDSSGPSKGQTWGDFDCDGHLDVVVANGTEGSDLVANMLYLAGEEGLFRRIRSGTFVNARSISAGVASADVDRDGDLDLALANWGGRGEEDQLWENRSAGKNWIGFVLEGRQSPRQPLGTKITVVVGRGEHRRELHRWLWPQTGYGSQNESSIHFGLGDATTIEEILIHWPSGRQEGLKPLTIGRYWPLIEGME